MFGAEFTKKKKKIHRHLEHRFPCMHWLNPLNSIPIKKTKKTHQWRQTWKNLTLAAWRQRLSSCVWTLLYCPSMDSRWGLCEHRSWPASRKNSVGRMKTWQKDKLIYHECQCKVLKADEQEHRYWGHSHYSSGWDRRGLVHLHLLVEPNSNQKCH